MRVSFIIPAHNEESHLPHTIDAIRRVAAELGAGGGLGGGGVGGVGGGAGGLEHEIIVADDASTDRTGDIARKRGAIVTRHERRQIAATRNLGARAATGDLLIFVDADTRVTTPAVRQAIEAIQIQRGRNQGARGGSGKRRIIGGGAMVTLDGRVPLYATILLGMTIALFRLCKYTGGCFLFCTREAFDAAGGWDETMFAGEEIRMAQSLKKHGRFVIVRDRVITSGRKLRTHSMREVFAQFIRIGLRPYKGVQSRENLDLWYGERRKDPLGPA